MCFGVDYQLGDTGMAGCAFDIVARRFRPNGGTMSNDVGRKTLRDNHAATRLRRLVNHQALPRLVDKLFKAIAQMHLPMIQVNVSRFFNVAPERDANLDGRKGLRGCAFL